MQIREETPADYEVIRRVNEAAFGRAEEADLIEALRQDEQIALSLVAIECDEVVGHILFCDIGIKTEIGVLAAVSLSPMAVLPEFQNRGIGTALVQRGLEALRAGQHEIVTVLGHPNFYARFGFNPAHEYGIACPYDAPPEAWMLLQLRPGVVDGQRGTVVFPRAFQTLN